MAIATDDIHRFSVDEYLAIVGSGDPRWEHTELIEGFVYDLSPEHVLHAEAVMALIQTFLMTAGADTRVLTNPSVRVADETLVQPDVVTLAGAVADRYAPLDGALVRIAVEVSVTTLAKDLGPKLRMYARAGVPEYWVVVPADGYLLRHTDPEGVSYNTVTRVEIGDDLTATVRHLLG